MSAQPHRWIGIGSTQTLLSASGALNASCSNDSATRNSNPASRGYDSETVSVDMPQGAHDRAVKGVIVEETDDSTLANRAEAVSLDEIECDVISLPSPDMDGTEPMYFGASPADWADDWDEEDNNIIRSYSRAKMNIVLESLCPRSAPHIVISPTEDVWDDHFTPWLNGVNPQWAFCLCVPPSDIAPTALPPIPLSATQKIQENEPTSVISEDRALDSPSPKRVFNSHRFKRSIKKASHERLVMYHVVTALQRRMCRSVAFAASSIAHSFRLRYDVPEFMTTFYKSFIWTDPAEPLLRTSRYHLGTIILDSICPFIAPHIIINAPPPENPWTSYMNATNDPQDCGFGRYLAVPASFVRHINTDDDDDDGYQFYYSHELEEPVDDLGYTFASDEEDYGYEDDEEEEIDDDDTCDSSTPETPSDLTDLELCSSFAFPPIEEVDESGEDDDIIEPCNYSSNKQTSSTHFDACAIYDEDEEEEELPDLDDPWYRSIMQRTNMAAT